MHAHDQNNQPARDVVVPLRRGDQVPPLRKVPPVPSKTVAVRRPLLTVERFVSWKRSTVMVVRRSSAVVSSGWHRREFVAVRRAAGYMLVGTARAIGALWRWATARELDAQLALNPKMVLEIRKLRQRIAAGGFAGTAVVP